MRNSTIIFLLTAILVFAYFGWQGLSWFALAIVLLILVPVVAVVVLFVVARRRMRKQMAELRKVFEQQAAARQTAQARSDAIDVEGKPKE